MSRNDPTVPLEHTRHVPVTEHIESHARLTPDRVAIRQGAVIWSYGELWSHSATLAAAIRTAGVRPGEAVAVCGEQSCALISALVAVLRSRAVLVALDPSLPVNRVRTMLDEAKVRLVIDCGSDGTPTIQSIDRAGEPHVGDAAYIFFTSGTTGIPKGILGTHDGLSHFLDWQRERFDIVPDDRCAQLTGLSFDVVLRSVFLPLSSGATLSLPEQPGEPDQIVPWLIATGATLVHVVPSLAQLWLAKLPANMVGVALRVVFFAGEPLSDVLVRSWRRVFPNCAVVNLYGPTETTLAKCYQVVPDPPDPGVQSVGYPLPSSQALVVNDAGQLCAVGEPGEVLIRTPFRTRGYINAPTENWRFQRNPFRSSDESDIVYRTGDLARYRPDGALALMGRIDDQVKIRGVRVEPDEVAAVLAKQPGVDGCFVTAVHSHGNPTLVAYVVARPDARRELRALLSTQLSAAMIPSRFVFLDALPLTPNGKVDRNALPAPDISSAELVAPRDGVEKALADIFCEILGVERVGVHDDFFALGGHSLFAAQIVARVRSVLSTELGLRALFEAPTIAALADLVRDASSAVSDEPFVRVDRTRPLPASFAQGRLWFLDQLDPGSAYNVPLVLRIDGALDGDALERALRELVSRHETLRTVFVAINGEPHQVVHDVSFDLSRVDAVSDADARTVISRVLHTPFDLASGPVVRATLIRLHDAAHIIVLCIHHIATDGWSRGVLVRELSALYRAFTAGQPSPLAPVALDYVDFAAWQRARLTGETLAQQIGFWTEHLAGAPAALELPTDRPRPTMKQSRGGRVPLVVPADVAARVRALCRREGATPFMVLLAAYTALLSRWSGQEDIVVGTPIANRTRQVLEGIVGFFVNTLALRTSLIGAPSFLELVRRIKHTALAAYGHQDLPFEKLVDELGVVRDTSRTPVFQALFAMQNVLAGDLVLGDLDVRAEPFDFDVAKFDVALSIDEREGRFIGDLEYDAALFTRATAERMAEHFNVLLEAALTTPDARVASLPLMTEAEEHRVLVEWNGTESRYPHDRCLHTLFEEQAQRAPDAIAIISDEGNVTYGELDRRANELASYLRSLGVGPDVLAAICLDRTIRMVVAVLGVLKAGGAYVPLDPNYPKERLAFMLADTRARVLVTEQAQHERLPPCSARVVLLDRDELSHHHDARPQPRVDPDNLAYVIYTSGSTGRPKGIALRHRGVVNNLWDLNRSFDVGPADRVLAVSSLSFDMSVYELLGTLVAGATIILPDPTQVRDPSYLLAKVIEHQVTVWNSAPALLTVFVDHAERVSQRADSIRLALLGGDWVPVTLPNRLEALSRARVIVLGGATELSIHSTVFPVDSTNPSWRSIPYGRPMANQLCYVLDEHLSPVALGVPGELFLGGVGLARGYLHRPDLTAMRFVPSPFREGDRIYRTGDLVRWGEDGVLELLGRIDHQVKLRGFRIEVGEIEAQLRSRVDVKDAVVTAHVDRSGDKLLVAYVVFRAEPTTASSLKEFLAGLLPDYMVPSAFVTLDKLPLSPNGKVDRKALPAPGDDAYEHATYVAPRTPKEQALVEIWRELLGAEQVGIDDNFFALGGHSLLAVQLVAKIRRDLDADLGLAELFAAPTISQMATRLRRSHGERGSVTASSRTEGPVGLLQPYWWTVQQDDPHLGVPLVIPELWRVRGPLDPSAIEHALRALGTRHEILRTNYVRDNNELRQIVRPAEPPFLPSYEYVDAGDDSVLSTMTDEFEKRVIDLGHGPVVMVKLIRLAPQEHALLLLMHHIVYDGPSAALFYGGLAGDRSDDLPFQFVDVAAYLRSYVDGPAGKADLEYWVRRFDGVEPLELPVDFSRAPTDERVAAKHTSTGKQFVAHFPYGSVSHVGDETLAEVVTAAARRTNITPLAFFLAGLAELLHTETGQTDIALQTTLNVRPLLGAEPLIGGFNSPIFVRIDLSKRTSHRELLLQMRDAFAQAYEHALVSPMQIVPVYAGRVNIGFGFGGDDALRLGDAVGTYVPIGGAGVMPFDLRPDISLDGRKLVVTFGYNTQLFKPETIDRLCVRYLAVLRSMAEDPDAKIPRQK